MLWLTLTLLLCVGVAHGASEEVIRQVPTPYYWMQAPYGNDDFNVGVHYTDDAVLECNDTRVADIGSYTIKMWITPELDIIYPGGNNSFETLDGTASWTASHDGFYLYINVTQDRHFGMYYCLLEDDSGQEWVVKTAINYKGATWGNGWFRYEQATIWSIVGSAVCGAIFAIGAIIWTRFEDQGEQRAADEDNFDAILAKLGYNNEGFVDDEKNGSVPNGKPSADMQIKETPTYVTQTMATPDDVTTSEPQAAPTYDNVSGVSRPESPADGNDDAPAPYDTVVEISGTAKALNPHPADADPGYEHVDLARVDNQTDTELNRSSVDIRL